MINLPGGRGMIDLRDVDHIEPRGEYSDECTLVMRSGRYYSVSAGGFNGSASKSMAHWAALVDAAKGAIPSWLPAKRALDAMDDGEGPWMHWGFGRDGERALWLDFKEWADDNLGQGFSLACCDGQLVDQVTSWCFHGYRVGREHKLPERRQAASVEHPEASGSDDPEPEAAPASFALRTSSGRAGGTP